MDAGTCFFTDTHNVLTAFGRICPGKDLADATLFIAIAVITAVLDIGKVKENGRVIEPEATYSNGVVRCDSCNS